MAGKSLNLHLKDVIQGNLEELTEWVALSAFEHSRESLLHQYARVILHFLRSEIPQLEKACTDLFAAAAPGTDAHFCRVASDLRLKIRKGELDRDVLGSIANDLPSLSESDWEGELCMLFGTAYAGLDDHLTAQSWFTRAIPAFARIGATRKQTKAMLNRVVAESHLHPERHLIPDYHQVYRISMRKDVRDVSVAGTCLLNISREYERMGALTAALKHCSRAVQILDRHFGSLSHGLALAHRCHLLLELERPAEACVSYELAKANTFPEVQAALTLLQSRVAGSPMPGEQAKHLLPTWSERQGGHGRNISLSKMEEKLIGVLAEGPKDRLELCSRLYGERLDIETRINRFKSLLATLRKKNPDLLVHENGTYRLSDTTYLPDQQSA